jgi:hypothetical protein
MVGRGERIKERRGGYRVCVQKHGRKGSLVRRRGRCENNVTIGLQEIERKLDWINLAQDTDRWRDLVDAVMNL